VSSVPRHSEEELRQQWAFLDALVDRQASSLKSGVQDLEEADLPVVAASTDVLYKDEISALTRRVTALEGERNALLRRIDLAEEARMAAETARAAAEAARAAAERAVAEARATSGPEVSAAPVAATPRRRGWWQRLRE
jgi:predicted  nucleic acid-binding Zn-ribbon protein